MKKIYMMLLMICTVCAFSACSDDDNKEDVPESGLPIANLKVPAFGEVGSDVTVRGRGFTAESKLFLQDLNGERTPVTIKTLTKEDLVFTVSEEVIGGTYTVILIQNGEWELGGILLTAKSPVSDLSVPADVAAGERLFISGTGFAEDCKVYLESKDGIRTEMENVEVTEQGIRFVIPGDFEPGAYTVYLDQRGEWLLGSVKVLTAEPKPVSKVIVATDYGDGGEPEVDYEMQLTYDGDDRLISMTKGSTTWDITYPADNKIKIQVFIPDNGWKGETTGTDEYVLENGIVKSYHSVSSYENRGKNCEDVTDYTFTQDGDGFLVRISGTTQTKEEGEVTETAQTAYAYTMNGSNLITIANEDIESGEPPYNIEYATSTQNSTLGIDLWALISGDFYWPDFDIRLLGISGKRLPLLPGSVTYEQWGMLMHYNFSYTINAVGQITEIRKEAVDDEYTTIYTLEYD